MNETVGQQFADCDFRVGPHLVPQRLLNLLTLRKLVVNIPDRPFKADCITAIKQLFLDCLEAVLASVMITRSALRSSWRKWLSLWAKRIAPTLVTSWRSP